MVFKRDLRIIRDHHQCSRDYSRLRTPLIDTGSIEPILVWNGADRTIKMVAGHFQAAEPQLKSWGE